MKGHTRTTTDGKKVPVRDHERVTTPARPIDHGTTERLRAQARQNAAMAAPPARPAPLPEVRLSSSSFTVTHWIRRADRDELFDLNAPYQRGSVWDDDQQRKLIKSLIMGVPIGNLIVSHMTDRHAAETGHHYRIVDGKQRIEAIRRFTSGDLDVPSWWFQDADLPPDPPEMVRYHDLSEGWRRSFEMTTLVPSMEFRPELEYRGRDANGNPKYRERSEDEILASEAELYGLINGGGTDQTDDDMANAAQVAADARARSGTEAP